MVRPSRDRPDRYYRLAKQGHWRARSAFKLLQIHEEFGVLHGAQVAVDLCAAPGSWTQVLLSVLKPGNQEDSENDDLPPSDEDIKERDHEDSAVPPSSSGGPDEAGDNGHGGLETADGLPFPVVEMVESEEPTPPKDESVKIIAVDLQAMAPLPGVIRIQGDITKMQTVQAVQTALGGRIADIVVCDGSPDVTGSSDLDDGLQSLLLLGTLDMCHRFLKTGGHMVCKAFKGENLDWRVMTLAPIFKTVRVFKPPSSRPTSNEAFLVCMNYSPLTRMRFHDPFCGKPHKMGNLSFELPPRLFDPESEQSTYQELVNELCPSCAQIWPVVTCGDVSRCPPCPQENVPSMNWDKFWQRIGNGNAMVETKRSNNRFFMGPKPQGMNQLGRVEPRSLESFESVFGDRIPTWPMGAKKKPGEGPNAEGTDEGKEEDGEGEGGKKKKKRRKVETGTRKKRTFKTPKDAEQIVPFEAES